MPDGRMTIDELARATGMTARNIRAHQSRGLLAPPAMRGRTGYYDEGHVARLRRIRDLQAQGFNLRAIERVLSGGADEALDFGRAALASFADEEPEVLTADELQERLGGAADARTLRRALKLGLVREREDGRFEAPTPTLLRAGAELVELGIPLRHALAVAQEVQRHSRAIAREFVRLFVQDVVGDASPAGVGPEEWARRRAALERLRPLATEAVGAAFRHEMRQAVEEELSRRLG